MKFDLALVYIAPLFIMIASIVVLAFSVVNILGDCNVIKAEKFLNISRILNIVFAGIIVLFAVIAFIVILVYEAAPAYGFIFNIIFSLAMLAGTILALVWNKKRA